MASAWGISWGDSWGSSWGPLHEVEELPFYGMGYSKLDKFDRRQEDQNEVIRKVNDKWDAIEAGKALVVPSVLLTQEPAQTSIKSAPHYGPVAPTIAMVSEQERLTKQRQEQEALLMLLLEAV